MSTPAAAPARRVICDGLEVRASDEWSVTMNIATGVVTLSPLRAGATPVLVEPDLAAMMEGSALGEICRELARDASHVAARGVTTQASKVMLVAAYTILDLRGEE